MATRWAHRICFFDAIGVLLLPVALTLITATRYFGAPLFVFAATLLWMVVISDGGGCRARTTWRLTAKATAVTQRCYLRWVEVSEERLLPLLECAIG